VNILLTAAPAIGVRITFRDAVVVVMKPVQIAVFFWSAAKKIFVRIVQNIAMNAAKHTVKTTEILIGVNIVKNRLAKIAEKNGKLLTVVGNHFATVVTIIIFSPVYIVMKKFVQSTSIPVRCVQIYSVNVMLKTVRNVITAHTVKNTSRRKYARPAIPTLMIGKCAKIARPRCAKVMGDRARAVVADYALNMLLIATANQAIIHG